MAWKGLLRIGLEVGLDKYLEGLKKDLGKNNKVFQHRITCWDHGWQESK